MALDLEKILLAGQAVNSLGDVLTNADRQRRGLQPIPTGNPVHQYFQLQQQQQRLQRQKAAQEAIQGLQGVDPTVRTLMSLFPEETVQSYVRNVTEPPPAAAAPRPMMPKIENIVSGDKTQSVMIMPDGSVQVLAEGPRWQPETVRPAASGGGGGAAGPSSKDFGFSRMHLINQEVVNPDGSKSIVQVPVGEIPRRGQPSMVFPMNLPVESQQAVTKSTQPAPDLDVNAKKQLRTYETSDTVLGEALDRIQKNPGAFDPLKSSVIQGAGKVAESVGSVAERKLLSPKEIEDRAFIRNQVARVINEMSGAAVPAAERDLLLSYLPSTTDGPEQIAAKLRAARDYSKQQASVLRESAPKRLQPTGGSPPPQASPPAPRRIKIDANGNIIQ